MNETITVNEFGATIRKPYYIIEDGAEMKVTAEDLVRAVKTRGLLGLMTLAEQMGLYERTTYPITGGSVDWFTVFFKIAQQIDLPEPTIPGTLNGTPATFEVVYRAED